MRVYLKTFKKPVYNLQESIIQFDSKNPVEIFGVNNVHINLIKSFFPKLKIIARGTSLIASGTQAELDRFNTKIDLLVEHFNAYNHLTEANIEFLMSDEAEDVLQTPEGSDEVLVHGLDGKLIKARSPNQSKMVHAVGENDMVFAVGPAGTGKTYTAVALAVRALKNRDVKRIIVTRPAVEAGEHLGFLPGDLKEKLDPYLQPLYDAFMDMIPSDRLESFIEKGVIQIAPLAFMRGRTLDNAFVILDEAQNATSAQMKMFLTRMGRNAKFLITGDVSQIDLPKAQQSGLIHSLKILKNVRGIEVIELDGSDVVRHKLVKKIIEAYDAQVQESHPSKKVMKKNEQHK